MIHQAVVYYQDLGLIGEGGWGIVRRMKRAKDGLICAMKRILPIHRANRAMLDRFVQEAQLLRRLQGHPNVVNVIDYHSRSVDGEGPMLALELLEGSLDSRIRRGMPVQEKIKAVRHVIEGLRFVHSHGVTHRDIKPENILVDRNGNYKISDFGCAKAPGWSIDMTQFSMGTETYMAPEQRRPYHHADARSDIHALGVLIFRLFVGRLPVFNEQHLIVQWQGWEKVDKQFFGLVARMTALRSDRRLQSMRDVKVEFEKLVEQRLIPGIGAEDSSEDGWSILGKVALGFAIGAGLVMLAKGK
jgi:serine/threonine protein kinase